MSWIKDFRKARGLSQMQMAQFAGISRTYFSIPEIKPILPADLNALFLELKQEFELADIAIDNQPYISPHRKILIFSRNSTLVSGTQNTMFRSMCHRTGNKPYR